MNVVLGLVALLCVGCVGLFVWSIIAGALDRRRDEGLRGELQELRRRGVLAQLEAATRSVSDSSTQELEAALRISVFRVASLPTGVAEVVIVLRPLTPRLVACVSLASAPSLPGLPRDVRARLVSLDEGALFDKALAQTLHGAPPLVDGNRLAGPIAMEWLLAGADVLGQAPLVLASCGDEIRWIEARPLGDGAALGRLLADAHAEGRFKGTVLFWDGALFHGVGAKEHTIIGPNTPDWTLVDVPPGMRASMALASGPVEIRRARGGPADGPS